MGKPRRKSTRSTKRASKKTPAIKKATNWTRDKFAALKPGLYSRVKQEFHDIDYAEQLDDKEKNFLAGFMEETLNAKFNHSNKKHYKSKAKRRESYNSNNARQRDTFAQMRATGRLMNGDVTVLMDQWLLERINAEYLHHDFESDVFDKKEDENEILTKRQYLKLLNSGADIPEDMRIFYMMYYDLKES